MDGVRIVKAGVERVDDLEPLWRSLVEHHTAVDPKPNGIAIRSPDDAWSYRRAEYLAWLSEPDAFVLIAQTDGRPVAYALVHFHDVADDHWVTRDRWAELESLAVLPEHRGSGIGGSLMDRVHEELRALGIRELVMGVVSTNEPALRFYARYGYRPWVTKLLGAIPDPP